MKLTLCTLTICAMVFTSILTTRAILRGESRRIRNTFLTAMKDPEGLAERQANLLQRLDMLSTQIAALNRRIERIDADQAGGGVSKKSERSTASRLSAQERHNEQTAQSLKTLTPLPSLLSELALYLDQSITHLDETILLMAAPQDLDLRLTAMEDKLADIDSYFSPLYSFLGLVYDPKKDDLVQRYPSLDLRVNALSEELDATRKDIAELRTWLGPRTIGPPQQR